MKRILFLSFILASLMSFEAKSQIIVSVTNVSAPGLCDGSAMVDTNDFATPATITWMQGNTVIQNGGYEISNLCVGQYNFIYSNGGFTTTSTFTIGTFVNPCSGNVININSWGESTANACDGSVAVTMFGGSAPYTYQWSNGGMVTAPTLTNLCAGQYSVTVIDANGCTSNASATVVVDTVPCYGFTGNLVFTNATSATACDGSAALSGAGGSGPFTFQWSNGCNSWSPTNLCVGTYTVTVSDINQCSFTCICTIGITPPNSNIDSISVIGTLATGSNVLGTMSSGWLYNCSIDLAALDTAYMVSATFGNTLFTQDSLYTSWYLVDTNGNSMYVNYNYSIPFGTTGLYNLVLQLYCPIKSQPVYYNIISVLNLAEAGVENNNLSQMNVYPNPVQNELNIGNLLTSFDYTLTNMDGKIIQIGKVSPLNKTIDLSNVTNGTYIIQLKNTLNAFTYRVIK